MRARRPRKLWILTLLAASLAPLAAGCPLGRVNRHLYGEDCDEDSDCESKRCHPVKRMCTMGCSKDAECPQGHACRSSMCDVKK